MCVCEPDYLDFFLTPSRLNDAAVVFLTLQPRREDCNSVRPEDWNPRIPVGISPVSKPSPPHPSTCAPTSLMHTSVQAVQTHFSGKKIRIIPNMSILGIE